MVKGTTSAKLVDIWYFIVEFDPWHVEHPQLEINYSEHLEIGYNVDEPQRPKFSTSTDLAEA